jgi:hypothetical protein
LPFCGAAQINCWLVKQKEDYQDKPTLIYFSGNAGSALTCFSDFFEDAHELTI